MTRSSLLALAALLLAGAPAAPGQIPQPGEAPDPWAALTAVRESLIAAGPTAAEFTQAYVPAGFSAGEEEHGRLALALPDCLRWDYRDPYPKSFLLCGGEAFYWNPEDKTGRRYPVDRQREPGLDLLLLGVEQLRERYQATAAAGEAGRVEIDLAPREGEAAPKGFASAHLVVDAASHRLVELSYLDPEGNLSRFTISGYGPLAADGLFSPPEGIAGEDG